MKRMGRLDSAAADADANAAAAAGGPPSQPTQGRQGDEGGGGVGGGGGAAAASVAGGGPLPVMTLRELAASIAAGLIRDMKDSNQQNKGRKTAFGSAIAKFIYNGKRRTMYMPPDMLDASEDLQTGCIYGALAKVTRLHFSICSNCGKTEQDLFTFDGITLTKERHRRVEHGRGDCD